jgi:DivIVA domain-containing protein
MLILLVVALVAAALAWGIAVLLTGRDPGLDPVEPDGRAVPLPTVRPLTESDLGVLRFDLAPRGYRMGQVDQALRRTAYDLGYKEELITVLEAEVAALREGRLDEAETLRQAREAALRPHGAAHPAESASGEPVVIDPASVPGGPVEPDDTADSDLSDEVLTDEVLTDEVLTDETTAAVGAPVVDADPVVDDRVASRARSNGAATTTGATTTGATTTGATTTGAEPADAEK